LIRRPFAHFSVFAPRLNIALAEDAVICIAFRIPFGIAGPSARATRRERSGERRGKLASTSKQQVVPGPQKIRSEEIFPEKWRPTQYPFYIGDESKTYQDRIKSLSRINKLWDHIENIHGLEFAAFSAGDKVCPICRSRRVIFILSGITHFKNHVQKVHKIKLRP
jgi:hypothetical protein